MTLEKEYFTFQAEISQLMGLIINTFYSNKEIFLRELISNASDALDKIRYQSLTEPEVLQSKEKLYVRIIPDKQNNVIRIRDTGIGMTKADLVSNLGTIAKSGTKAFMEALSTGDITLIGQFGVGFYASFLVADKVQFITKHNDDEQYIWESAAGGYYTITRDDVNEPLGRGSEVRLFMKEDQLSFLEEKVIKNTVKTYSEFISYPIELEVEKEMESEDDNSRFKEIITECEELNRTKPLWTRSPKTVRPEEYAEFYRTLTNDWNDPLAYKHFAVEGQLQFRGLLFLPLRPPFYLFDKKIKSNGIKLYVRRVFVMDGCDALMPSWLNFITGIVDSEDLPLNISREVLQQNKVLKMICKNLVKRCIEMFQEMANDQKDLYKLFYRFFSKSIKLGIHEDEQNREKLLELLRFQSTKTEGYQMTTLREYVDRMPRYQRHIFYIIGESLSMISHSPFLENFKKKGIEVLFMTEPIDEYMFTRLTEYDEIPFSCISKEGIVIGQDSENDRMIREMQKRQYGTLCRVIKDTLGDQVEKVVLSYLLQDSPCVLTTKQYAWSANMERIMKAQTDLEDTLSDYMTSKKIFELNPDHFIIQKLNQKIILSPNDCTAKELILLLFDTALLTSGFSLEDPRRFSNRVNRMISLGLSIDNTELEPTEAQASQYDQEVYLKREFD